MFVVVLLVMFLLLALLCLLNLVFRGDFDRRLGGFPGGKGGWGARVKEGKEGEGRLGRGGLAEPLCHVHLQLLGLPASSLANSGPPSAAHGMEVTDPELGGSAPGEVSSRKAVPTAILQVASLVSPIAATFPVVDAVEFFAGDAAVTRGLRELGFAAVPFELKMHPGMNMLTPEGFALAIILCCRIRPGGFCLLAPVCSALAKRRGA